MTVRRGQVDTASRAICAWCGLYCPPGSDGPCCCPSCASYFGRFGTSLLRLQLRYDVFSFSAGLFRKLCGWCLRFFVTEDPAESCCSPEHLLLFSDAGKRSEFRVRLDAYDEKHHSGVLEQRRRKGKVRRRCPWCLQWFYGSPRASFCCPSHEKLRQRHGGTQAEFFRRFGIEGIVDGKYRKVCQCCRRPFLTSNVTQKSCSAACNKRFAKHGRVSDALAGVRRDLLTGCPLPADADWRAKVEWVMSLPAAQRYAFTVTWGDDERAYAREIEKVSVGRGGALGDAGLAELARGVDDLDGL